MPAIPKTITLDEMTEHISKSAKDELGVPESTIMRYFWYCFSHEPLVSFAEIKARLGEPSIRETYLNEMKLKELQFITRTQGPYIKVATDKRALRHTCPSGNSYVLNSGGVKVFDPQDIAYFKKSGFRIIEEKSVILEAEQE